jgi:hypothetical protein
MTRIIPLPHGDSDEPAHSGQTILVRIEMPPLFPREGPSLGENPLASRYQAMVCVCVCVSPTMFKVQS